MFEYVLVQLETSRTIILSKWSLGGASQVFYSHALEQKIETNLKDVVYITLCLKGYFIFDLSVHWQGFGPPLTRVVINNDQVLLVITKARRQRGRQ